MNTQEKLDTLSTVVIEAFRTNKGLEYVYSQAAPIAYANGIAMSEVEPLVKTIGKDNGLYTDLEDRLENAKISVEGWILPDGLSYDSMIGWSKEVSKVYQVPEKKALELIKARLDSVNYLIPTKPQLSGWKKSALECWKDNRDEPTAMEVRRWIGEGGHLYTQAIHELFQQLVQWGANNA